MVFGSTARPRVAGMLFGVLLGACSPGKGASKTPSDASACDAAGECAALRQQLRRLEARVRQLEDGAGGEYATPSKGGSSRATSRDEELPVVKLRPPVSTEARSLEPSSTADAADVPWMTEASEPAAAEESPPIDFSKTVAVHETPPDRVSEVPASRRYRLVGSRLVHLTKGSRASELKRRSKHGQRGSDDEVVRAYEAAMQVYRNGAYADAERSFADLAREHPEHAYADNALYWQGEAAYDQARYADALAAFTDVVERYGGGNKAADALLKIGLCYGRLGDRANAYDVLTQLIAAYPRSNASRLAKERLSEYSGAGE